MIVTLENANKKNLSGIFVRLPILWVDDKEGIDWEACEEKLEKAEDMGIPPEKYCPECVDKNNKVETWGFENVALDTIVSFNDIDGKTIRIIYYDGVQRKYEISETAFIEKIKDHIILL